MCSYKQQCRIFLSALNKIFISKEIYAAAKILICRYRTPVMFVLLSGMSNKNNKSGISSRIDIANV